MISFFQIFRCLVQFEVKKKILVKSRLCEVRLSHQSDCSVLEFIFVGKKILTGVGRNLSV